MELSKEKRAELQKELVDRHYDICDVALETDDLSVDDEDLMEAVSEWLEENGLGDIDTDQLEDILEDARAEVIERDNDAIEWREQVEEAQTGQY